MTDTRTEARYTMLEARSDHVPAGGPDGINDGWLDGARRLLSPNCDDRPAGIGIDLLVVHGISLPAGCFIVDAVDRLFTNRLTSRDIRRLGPEMDGLRVSSHLLIDRAGKITQYVPVHKRAWHAGVSSFAGRDHCNDFSIGIELMGCDDLPYEEAQYRALAECTRCLRRLYPSLNDDDRIVGHCHIAPGRKTDPGSSFDWEYYFHQLRESD